MFRNEGGLHGFKVVPGIVLGILLLIVSCAEVPITHRQSLHLVPDSELMTLSYQQYNQVLHKSRLSADTQEEAMVRRVGGRIARVAETFLREAGQGETIKNYHWEFNLIEDEKTVNAWVLPGGRAAVYSGILRYTQDETGLAVVLGDEVGHAIAGHGNERMSQGLLAQLGGMALSVALSTKPQQAQSLFMTAYGASASLGVLLPFSRLEESEADHIGLIPARRAFTAGAGIISALTVVSIFRHACIGFARHVTRCWPTTGHNGCRGGGNAGCPDKFSTANRSGHTQLHMRISLESTLILPVTGTTIG